MAEEAKKELEEVVEAVEDLIDANKMPFNRWLIKLLVEKLIVPAVIPALTAVATSICGWYFIGQTQLTGQAVDAGVRAAEVEVEKLERARELLEDLEDEARPDRDLTADEIDDRLEVLREEWSHLEPPEPMNTDDAINAMDQRITEQRAAFPEDYLRGKLNAKK